MTKNELVCGVHPVMEALRSDLHVEKLLIRRDAGGEGIRDLKNLARELGVPWQPVPGEKLDRLTATEAIRLFLGRHDHPSTPRTVEVGQPGDLMILTPGAVADELASDMVATTIVGGRVS